jgi:hydrogenase expression/formation protein HypC
MCLAVPARVLSVDDERGTAEVEQDGVRRLASLAVLRFDEVPVVPGDWLLLHAGLATEQITSEEAAELTALLAGTETKGDR